MKLKNSQKRLKSQRRKGEERKGVEALHLPLKQQLLLLKLTNLNLQEGSKKSRHF